MVVHRFYGVLGLASVATLAASLLAPRESAAAPNEALPEPYSASLVPSVMGVFYVPRGDELGARAGAGAEIVFFTWANHSDNFGPAEGKIRFDVAGLWEPGDSDVWMILYRGGASLSLERNPRRNWLVPYFSADIGGIHDHSLGGSFFLDPGGGLYVVYVKNFIVDVEAGYLFALADADNLSGFKSHLTVSFALW
jgi:hypothetical protein